VRTRSTSVSASPTSPRPSAREAALSAIREGKTDGYTSNKGTRELREAISARYDADWDLTVDPGDVIATAGGSEALHIALEAHVDPGQEVLFPDPGFVSYDALTRIADGVPRPLPLREDLTLDPETVEAAITEETAAFVVNSPANPTGAVQSTEDMREFARIADEHDLLCISDEVYEHIVFEGEHRSPLSFAESDNVVVVGACSKTYSMTGWRLGWVTASTRRIERMLRVHQYAQACASAPAQYAAEGALRGPQDVVREMRETFEERRDVVLDGLADAGLETPTPQGAFYAMPSGPGGLGRRGALAWGDRRPRRGVRRERCGPRPSLLRHGHRGAEGGALDHPRGHAGGPLADRVSETFMGRPSPR